MNKSTIRDVARQLGSALALVAGLILLASLVNGDGAFIRLSDLGAAEQLTANSQ